MISLSLSEGFCFDLLAIAQVKISKSLYLSNSSYKTHQNIFLDLWHDIEKQIGITKIKEVTESDEYKRLVDANNKVFDLVDKVKDDSIKGSEIDFQNHQRFLLKKKIQEKFFGGDLREEKIGYKE